MATDDTVPHGVLAAIDPTIRPRPATRHRIREAIYATRPDAWDMTEVESRAGLSHPQCLSAVYNKNAALHTQLRFARAHSRGLGRAVEQILCGYDPVYGEDTFPAEGLVLEDPWGGAWRVTRERVPPCAPDRDPEEWTHPGESVGELLGRAEAPPPVPDRGDHGIRRMAAPRLTDPPPPRDLRAEVPGLPGLRRDHPDRREPRGRPKAPDPIPAPSPDPFDALRMPDERDPES